MTYVCNHRSQIIKLWKHQREFSQLVFWTKANPSLDRKCDFSINCYCLINEKYVVAPKISLVRNMGSDGSGINSIKIENDTLCTQKISLEKYFDICDNLSKKESSELRKMWSDFKNKNFSIKQRAVTLFYYYTCLLFGMHLADLILNMLKRKK